MSEQTAGESYEAASQRLDKAFARLEASVRSLNGRMRARARADVDIDKLKSERARLAVELDRESARARRLDDSAAEVARRLVGAMEEVRDVLSGEG